MNQEYRYEIWSVENFAKYFAQQTKHRPDIHYCWVLGAGASIPSGIQGAATLAERWLGELHDRFQHEQGARTPFLDWLKSNARSQFGRGFENDIILKPNPKGHSWGKHYFAIYDAMFRYAPADGFAYLEREMEDKHPSLGYYILSKIMKEPLGPSKATGSPTFAPHNLCITTNFDDLLAQAMVGYFGKLPLTIGHESLASYLQPHYRRPVVAKVHRDLMLSPMSSASQMRNLRPQWALPLHNAFQTYQPIFIGYAGNDQSLMGYLSSLQCGEFGERRPIWTLYAPDGFDREAFESDSENDILLDFLNSHRAILVPVSGFDEFMVLLLSELSGVIDLAKIQESAQKQASAYENACTNIAENWKDDRFLKVLPPESAIVHTSKGVIYWKTNEPEKAKSELEIAISIDPKYGKAYNYLGNICADAGDVVNAEKNYRKAIELDSNYFKAHYNLGLLLSDGGKQEDAIKSYNDAIRIEVDDAEAYNGLGDALSSLDKDVEALDAYKKAVEIDPRNIRSLNGLGIELSKLGKDLDAFSVFERALEIDPENEYVNINYGVILDRNEKYLDAEKHYRQAIKSNPKSYQAYNYLGVSLSLLDRVEDSLAAFRKAISLKPEDTAIRCNFGIALYKLKEMKDALECFNVVLRSDPDNEVANHYKGRLEGEVVPKRKRKRPAKIISKD